jgi:hypothetical protein
MVEAGLAATPVEQRLGLLDTDLQGSCQVVSTSTVPCSSGSSACREQQDLRGRAR